MEHRPLVSVIITNYNYARYVSHAIESVLAQTYSPIQLVVVDDGSTDDSLNVLSAYAHRAQLVFKSNGGQASAFNTGFSRTSGGIVCLLDADDVWAIRKVEGVVEAAAHSPRAALFVHRMQSIDQNGAPLGAPWPARIVSGALAEILDHSGGYWPCPPTSGLSFRRGALERLLPMPEAAWRACADAYLLALAPYLGEVSACPEALGLYRVHGNNLWATLGPKDTSRAEVARLATDIERRLQLVRQAAALLQLPMHQSLADHYEYQFYRASVGDFRSLLRLCQMAFSPPPFLTRVDALKAPLGAVRRALRHRLFGPITHAAKDDAR